MSIVNCPKCRDQVTLPIGASREAVVQCPLCSAQFPLQEILAQLPPALVVIHDPGASAAVRESSDWLGASSAAAAEQDPESGEAPAFHFEPGSAAAVRPRAKRVARPRGRPSSPVRQIVQIVLGGVVGIGLAQVILWWLPANLSVENRDLTGFGRKYGRYVPFLVPASVRQTQTEIDDLDPATARRSDSIDLIPVKPGSKSSAKTVPGFQFAKSRLKGENGETRSSAVSASEMDAAKAPAADTAKPKDTDAAPLGENKPASPDSNPVTTESKPALPGETPPSTPPDAASKVEPSKNDTPAPTPSPPEAPAPQASAPARVDAKEVETRFAAMRDACNALDAVSKPDNPEITNEMRPLVRDFYRSTAELGQAMAYSNPDDADVRRTTLEVVALLSRIANRSERVDLLESATESWLKRLEPPGGICLVGTVKSTQQKGKYFETMLELRDSQTLPMLTPSDPSEQIPVNSRALVLGVVLDEPTKELAGYNGDAKRAILNGIFVAL